mmetsp:Transcript_48219/g.93117  ORF Transcript_48219/g.93117 Transcript_48219/m.93117 type:complete len:128 (+) Transcript_48219:3-386(+)
MVSLADEAIEDYTRCRQGEETLLIDALHTQRSMIAQQRYDHTTSKTIECFISILTTADTSRASSQLSACTTRKYATDKLSMPQPAAVPEANTSALLAAKTVAEEMCPLKPTTATTTTTTTTPAPYYH